MPYITALRDRLYTFVGPESWYYFRVLSLVFGITLAFGMTHAVFITAEQSKEIVDTLREQLGFLENFATWQLFLFIFVNNAGKAFVAMLTGILFGIIPILFIIINGLAIGAMVVLMAHHMSTTAVIAGLLPHGIIEIPAVLIAAAYGVYLGERFWKRLKEKTPFTPALTATVKAFARRILPFLAIAALIEVTLSVLIIGVLQ